MRRILKSIFDAIVRCLNKAFEGLDTDDPKVRQELIEMFFNSSRQYPMF